MAAPLVYDIKDISVVSLDTSAAPQTYSLPFAPALAQAILIKDWSGNAAANAITVIADNGGNIDNSPSFVMNQAFACVIFVNNGPNWSVAGAAVGAAGGDLSGSFPNPIVVSTHLSAPLPIVQGGTGSATGAVGGDLSGNLPNPSVAKINGATLGSTTASAGNILIGSGSSWVTRAMSGDATISSTGAVTVTTAGSAAPTGPAGGDLSSTYPNPTVAKIKGAALGTTTATSANILVGDGSSWQTRAVSGDATMSSAGVVSVAYTPQTYDSGTKSPTGTASATGVMMGLAGSLSPARNGKFLVAISGHAHNTNAGGSYNVALAYGTGAAPTNGAAIVGTPIGSIVQGTNSSASQKLPFSIIGIVSGSVGTTYWLDAVLNNNGGGTVTIDACNLCGHEI